MENRKATKRALLTSITALVMCVVMLAGTTFAWFTDTASTGVNKIQAGNLDVGFEYWNGRGYVDATDVSLFSEDTCWEPGHTEVVYLKVINKGKLALKYKLSTINTFEYQYAKNSKGNQILLSNYLKIGVAENKNASDGTYATREAAIAAIANNTVDYTSYTKASVLAPNAADYLAFVVYMPTSVGNEANAVDSSNLPWIRFNLALNATQVEHENDSFGNEYDKDLPYPIAGQDLQMTGTLLKDELKVGTPVILLGADASDYNGWGVGYTATINLNGNSLTTGTGHQPVITVGSSGNLTITGDGTVDASGGSENITAVTVDNGGKLTIKSGTFIGKDKNSCIYNNGGTIVIEGGFFKCEGPYNGKYYVLNQENSSSGTITVKGGTFVNYNPSTGDDNLGGNFVADGYKVVPETQTNGDVWYTVVPE